MAGAEKSVFEVEIVSRELNLVEIIRLKNGHLKPEVTGLSGKEN